MSTLSYHFPEFATSAVTVRPSRGIVQLAREVGARSRPVSGQRGRSPPPPARTITAWSNGYHRRGIRSAKLWNRPVGA